MVKKRTSLDAILPTASQSKSPSSIDVTPGNDSSSTEKPIGRRPNVKQQALYLKNPVHRQLRVLAFEEEKKMHDLCMEALDLLFANRGLPSIEELQAGE